MKAGRGEQVGAAASLMVFCIFAMLAFSSIMLGAVAYKNIAGTSRDGSEARICLSYIWSTVKNYDVAESVYVEDFHGISALYVDEVYGETLYHTIIYHHDGWVCELFTEAGVEHPLGNGVRIMEVDSLRFQQIDDRNIMASSGEHSVFITPRGQTRSVSPVP